MQIRNGIVLNGANDRFERFDIRFANGRIYQRGIFPVDADDFDAEGLYVIPGFIDEHVHGSVGVEFASADEDFEKARVYLASKGVTGFAATVRALPVEQTVAAMKNILRESKKESRGAAILGIHTEGPFVSYKKTGVMHPPKVECDIPAMEALCAAGEGFWKLMTIAPERENALEAIAYAAAHGVTASLGHTDATYEQALAGADTGAAKATHIFDAMRPFTHRDPGIIGLALTDERINCEMICDLVHVYAPAIKLVLAAKGASGVTLISDAGVMSGLGDGVYNVDGHERIVENGICRNTEGRIAGSCVSMLEGAKNLLKMGVPLEDISVMASKNPAKALGLESERGCILEGRYADFIVCDGDLNIKAVFVEGVRRF